MILNMLDLAMLDVKKIELDKKTVNLSELVEDRVNNCRKIYLQGKKIDFELKIEPDIMVSVDPNYIRQTVDNLVINAITYSQSGTIKVSVLRKGKNMVEFIIQDEGIGIPKSELFDIFNPFKMGIHTQSKAEGRGVGLALCKSAIEAHGGAINVTSENGKGAMFVVTLGL
jgi:signal transduction histidine kinase